MTPHDDEQQTTGTGADGLSRELADQRADLADLTADVRDLSDAVATLADHLMSGTPGGVAGFAAKRAPWCWRGLDPDAAEKLWRDLAEWVAWLRGRYPIAEQLPSCWPKHPELVEELTALRAVWNAAYLDPAAHPGAAMDFHDRWLRGVLARVRAWGVHCQDEHRDRAPGVYAAETTDPDSAPRA